MSTDANGAAHSFQLSHVASHWTFDQHKWTQHDAVHSPTTYPYHAIVQCWFDRFVVRGGLLLSSTTPFDTTSHSIPTQPISTQPIPIPRNHIGPHVWQQLERPSSAHPRRVLLVDMPGLLRPLHHYSNAQMNCPVDHTHKLVSQYGNLDQDSSDDDNNDVKFAEDHWFCEGCADVMKPYFVPAVQIKWQDCELKSSTGLKSSTMWNEGVVVGMSDRSAAWDCDVVKQIFPMFARVDASDKWAAWLDRITRPLWIVHHQRNVWIVDSL